MRLWTVQPLSALEEIEKTGFFRCQREKSFTLLIRGKYVQATLWEIQRGDVKSVQVLPAQV